MWEKIRRAEELLELTKYNADNEVKQAMSSDYNLYLKFVHAFCTWQY